MSDSQQTATAASSVVAVSTAPPWCSKSVCDLATSWPTEQTDDVATRSNVSNFAVPTMAPTTIGAYLSRRHCVLQCDTVATPPFFSAHRQYCCFCSRISAPIRRWFDKLGLKTAAALLGKKRHHPLVAFFSTSGGSYVYGAFACALACHVCFGNRYNRRRHFYSLSKPNLHRCGCYYLHSYRGCCLHNCFDKYQNAHRRSLCLQFCTDRRLK